jgi:hypothetical protein
MFGLAFSDAGAIARFARMDANYTIGKRNRSMTIPKIDPPIAQMPDRALLELANGGMPPEQTARLALLSAKQRSGTLVGNEPQELGALLQIYSDGWLRKTDALVEAIRRGLMIPTES